MSDTCDGGRRVYRGQVVRWEGERYRVVRRREVDGMAAFQIGTHEVYLAAFDGGFDPAWVPESEVEPADVGEMP